MALALVAGVLLVGCKQREEAHKLYEKARRLLTLDPPSFTRAELLLRKALEVEPTFTPARITLADILLSRNNLLFSRQQAAHHLREVLRLEPNHIGAHYRLGLIALQERDYHLALEEMETAHRLLSLPFSLGPGEEWLDLFISRGFLLLERADFHQAEAVFKHSLSFLVFCSLPLGGETR